MPRKKNSSGFVFLACPWAPAGGGMYKVMDYLMQAQAKYACQIELRILDSRGGGSVILSFLVLARAIFTLVVTSLRGKVAGVHVNMAERLSVFRKGLLIVVAKTLGTPVVLHLHAAQLCDFYAGLPRVLQALMRWVFSLPDVVVVLGQRARHFVITDLRVPPDKVEILINGVPGPAVPPPTVRRPTPNIVFLGNLSERKGVSDLLVALSTPEILARPWQAIIAGGGDVAGYAAKAASLGLSKRVDFPGWLTQAQSGQMLESADLLVLPSYDEGLPLVILEALSYGVAVICTPVGEIPQVLTHADDAWFVAPGNPGELALALGILLDDGSLRRALGTSGRGKYETTFSYKVFFYHVLDIYRRYFGVGTTSDVKQELLK